MPRYSDDKEDDDREYERRGRSRRSYSSSSSSSLESDRKEKKKKSKKKKSNKKSKETSEERRIRKEEEQLLKKELKAQKESQLAAHMSAELGYTNKDNPFNDSNLGQNFVWAKKRQKDIKSGFSREDREKRDEERKREVMTELEKLKKKRAEREIEKELREEEQLRLQRELNEASMGDWRAKEDEFHLHQAKMRAQIRVKEGRPKPIDLLAINMSLASDGKLATEFELLGIDVNLDEPYTIFYDLNINEIEDLHKDIQLYLSLEQDPENRQFWEAMMIVCDDELSMENMKSAPSGFRTGVNDAVLEEINRMLEHKTVEQLDQLKDQVQKKLSSGGPVDVEYWEALLKGVIVWRAKARLRDMHTAMLEKRLEQLKAHREKEVDEEEEDEGPKHPSIEEQLRHKKINNNSAFVEHLSRGFGDSEEEDLGAADEEFQGEMQLEKKTYHWQDKYRPRKPKYFNKVHTGYEWNKYNRTHYDSDNPPPKVVKGYKFNVFYPDLIEKTKTPTYHIVKDPSNPETLILKFVAGPPYEDVAFKIVNREWEYGHRRGFRSSFDRGVLQLHFRFRRNAYRK